MAVDDFFGVDGFVAHRDVDVAVAGDELGDVGRHAVHDRVGDQDSAEIVRGEPQRFAAAVGDPAAGQGVADQLTDGGSGDVVGESYEGRRPGGMPRPETANTARSLARLAELYHRALADLLRLNHGNGWQAETPLPDGTEVRIPDRGLAPLLAARFAAAVLVDPTLNAPQRIEAIQALVPVAAANPTALDTVLARLLLAARPADPASRDALLDLAENARSTGTNGTSSPFHPGSPG